MSEKPIPNFEVYYKDEKTASVIVDPPRVHVTRHVIHPVKQIFAKDELSMFKLGLVLRLRCWSIGHANLDRYHKKLGLDNYDVNGIGKKTHDISWNDYIWFKLKARILGFGMYLSV